MQEIISLTINEIKDMIKTRWQTRDIRTRALCIVGHRGVGKSEAVHQCASELSKETGRKIEGKLLNLQFCEPPDFMGLPFIDKDGVTQHARPSLIPSEGEGILFLDEANRCNRDNRQGLISLLQDRQVNGHKLGKGWTIVLAMNPTEADGVSYEVQEFDAALESRLTKIAFKGDIKAYTKYIVDLYGDIHPVVRWVINQPDMVDFKGSTRTSPRDLVNLVMAIGSDNGGKISPDNKINFNTVAAEIGMGAAATFKKFLASEDYIVPEDIIDRFDDMMAKRLDKLEKDGRHDVLNSLINGVCNVLSNRKQKDLRTKHLKNLIRYQEAISADSKMAFWLAMGEHITDNDYFNKICDYSAENSKVVKDFFKAREKEMQNAE